ncbi:MAG: YicC family protein [Firmicutes bacterium]|nr:YicC family protein [Bacillota bacterium]
MTGYGRAKLEQDGLNINIDIKSVNNRFLDVGIKLPRQLLYLEDSLKKILGSKLNRGSVSVFINLDDRRELSKDMHIDMSLAKSYKCAAESLSKNLSVQNDFTVSSLMKSPDVISFIDSGEDKLIEELTLQAFDIALKSLVDMRKTEGAELLKDINSRLDKILKETETIKGRAPYLEKEYSEKLKKRIKEHIEGVNFDEGRLLEEVAFFVDKSNIDEELIRLTSHIGQFKALCKSTEPMGRKMDFLVQELNREANTICSKSNDLIITNAALNLKAEIEKIKEQVQNLE